MRASLVVVSSILLLAGCSTGVGIDTPIQGPDPTALGQVSFQLQATAGTAFRIRLYRTPPASLDKKAYFESDCIDYLDGFTIKGLDEGDQYVAVFLQYSAATCIDSSLTGVGVRGDIEVTKAGTGNAYYYIQINKLDTMTALPLPPDSLRNPETAGTVLACTVDDDCRGPCKDTGLCLYPKEDYQFHPSAVCDNNICRLPSLFPLNSKLPRAFHSSVPMPDGSVALVGGFNRATATTGTTTGTRLISGDAEGTAGVEVFDPATALFSQAGTPTPLDMLGGMGPAVATLDGQLALFANKTCANLVAACPVNDTGKSCLVGCSSAGTPTFILADPATDTFVSIPLTGVASGIVLAANVLDSAGQEKILGRPGIVTADEIAGAATQTVKPLMCSPKATAAADCAALAGAPDLFPRYQTAGACLVTENGLCEKYVIVGGNIVANDPLVEEYKSGTWATVTSDPASEPPAILLGAELFVTGNHVLAIGGVDGNWTPQEVAGLRITSGASKDLVSSVKVSFLDSTGTSIASKGLLKRIHHQVTAIAEDTFLVTGGQDATHTPYKSAVRCSVGTDATGGLTLTCAELSALPRWGHAATLIPSGILGGSVIVSGGLTQDSGLHFAEAVEMFLQLPAGL